MLNIKNFYKSNLVKWFLKHILTVASCVLITALGIAYIVWSSPGSTTIGENISTNNITAFGDLTVYGNLRAKTGRTATLVVAALDAPAANKAQADYVCDGVADNVDIQTAINALTTGRTRIETVKITGNFNLSAALNLPSYTRLDLSEAKLTLATGANDYLIKNSDASGGNTDIEIIDGILDGANQAPNKPAIHFTKVSNFKILRNKIINVGGAFINVAGSFNGLIDGNHCDTATTGIMINGQSDYSTPSYRIRVTNNYVRNWGPAGVGIWARYASYEVVIEGNNLLSVADDNAMVVSHRAHDITIANNVVNGEDIVISGEGEIGDNQNAKTTVIGNTVTDGDIAIVTARYVTVTGNKVSGGMIFTRLDSQDTVIIGNITNDSNTYGIGVYDRALRTTVTGNVITRPQEDGIYIYNGVIGAIVTGNTILDGGRVGASRNGIHIDANSDRITIDNNYLKNTAGQNMYYGILIDNANCEEIVIGDGNIFDGIANPIYNK